MKPKAQAYKVQVHPKRSNLLCIVVEDQEKPEKPLKSVRELMGNGAAGQLDPPKIQVGLKICSKKFNGFVTTVNPF